MTHPESEPRIKYNPWPGAPSKYDPSFCLKVLEMLREGQSKIEIAAELGVHRETLDNWCKKHEQFFDTMELGLEFSEAYWHKAGRINIYNKEFNNVLYQHQMRVRFGLDKNEQQHNHTVSVSETQEASEFIKSREKEL